MANLKILVLILAAICGSFMNPTADGQILPASLEKVIAAKNHDDELRARFLASEEALPVQPSGEVDLTD